MNSKHPKIAGKGRNVYFHGCEYFPIFSNISKYFRMKIFRNSESVTNPETIA